MSVSSDSREARHRRTVGAVAAVALLACSVQGCGGDGGAGGGPAEPVGLGLVLPTTRLQITRTIEIEAISTFSRARVERPDCDWYVDGVAGGDSTVGIITQSNPATFVAPGAVPDGGGVEITAVSRGSSSFEASDSLRIAFTIRYIDADNGSDTPGGGPWSDPLKTLTYALSLASDGDTLCALPGSYDPDHGEDGSHIIPTGVTLIGVHRDSCLIYGSGAALAVVHLEDGATIESFTIGNWDQDNIGILSEGGGEIRDIAVTGEFGYCAIRARGNAGESAVAIEDCRLANESPARGSGNALELLDGSHSSVRGCAVSGWEFGFYVNTNSDPLLEANTITDNEYGVVAAGTSAPDLGGGARGSAGANTIRDNSLVGLQNVTPGAIWALNNTWTNDPPAEGPPTPADFVNVVGGTVIWAR